jgi:flagellar protein FlaG
MIIQRTDAGQAGQIARPVTVDLPKVAADVAKPVPTATQEPSLQQLHSAVGAINQVMQASGRNLSFSVDPTTKKSVVQVTDAQTGELVRQIPSREVLAIAESIDEFLQRGLLLRQKA